MDSIQRRYHTIQCSTANSTAVYTVVCCGGTMVVVEGTAGQLLKAYPCTNRKHTQYRYYSDNVQLKVYNVMYSTTKQRARRVSTRSWDRYSLAWHQYVPYHTPSTPTVTPPYSGYYHISYDPKFAYVFLDSENCRRRLRHWFPKTPSSPPHTNHCAYPSVWAYRRPTGG